MLGSAGCSKPWSRPARARRARRAEWGWGCGWPGAPEEALLEGREAACLADEHVGDLAHLDADEEHGVAGVLLVQALPKCLWTQREQKQPEPRRRASAASRAHGAWGHKPLNSLSLVSEALAGTKGVARSARFAGPQSAGPRNLVQ